MMTTTPSNEEKSEGTEPQSLQPTNSSSSPHQNNTVKDVTPTTGKPSTAEAVSTKVTAPPDTDLNGTTTGKPAEPTPQRRKREASDTTETDSDNFSFEPEHLPLEVDALNGSTIAKGNVSLDFTVFVSFIPILLYGGVWYLCCVILWALSRVYITYSHMDNSDLS